MLQLKSASQQENIQAEHRRRSSVNLGVQDIFADKYV